MEKERKGNGTEEERSGNNVGEKTKGNVITETKREKKYFRKVVVINYAEY